MEIYLCSDSQINLSWIKNEKYIVSKANNRDVEQICDSVFRKSLQYVGTEMNLADMLTKSFEKWDP
jgi:hypothetical protein